MNFNQIIKQTLEDIRTKLTDEFDRNFERKAFLTNVGAKPNLSIKGVRY